MKLLMIRFMYVHWTLDSINMKMKVVLRGKYLKSITPSLSCTVGFFLSTPP